MSEIYWVPCVQCWLRETESAISIISIQRTRQTEKKTPRHSICCDRYTPESRRKNHASFTGAYSQLLPLKCCLGLFIIKAQKKTKHTKRVTDYNRLYMQITVNSSLPLAYIRKKTIRTVHRKRCQQHRSRNLSCFDFVCVCISKHDWSKLRIFVKFLKDICLGTRNID